MVQSASEVQECTQLTESEGEIIRQNGIKISRSLTHTAYRGIGIVGQPEAQYYFYRPLSLYLQIAVAAGFTLDDFEEPALLNKNANGRGVCWNDMPEIPPIVAMRFRRND